MQTENNSDQQLKEFTQCIKVSVIFVKAKCSEELPSMDICVQRENLMVLGPLTLELSGKSSLLLKQNQIDLCSRQPQPVD